MEEKELLQVFYDLDLFDRRIISCYSMMGGICNSILMKYQNIAKKKGMTFPLEPFLHFLEFYDDYKEDFLCYRYKKHIDFINPEKSIMYDLPTDDFISISREPIFRKNGKFYFNLIRLIRVDEDNRYKITYKIIYNPKNRKFAIHLYLYNEGVDESVTEYIVKDENIKKVLTLDLKNIYTE